MWMMAWCFPVCVIVNSIIFKSYRDRRNTHTAKWVSNWEQLLRRFRRFFVGNRPWRWEVPIFSHHQKIYMQWCIYRGYAHGFFHRQLRVYSIAKGWECIANQRAVVKSTVAFQPWCPGAGYQSLHQNSGLFLSFPCIWHMHCMCLMHLCLSSRYPHVYHYIILYHITHIRNFWSHGFMSCFAKTHLAPQKLLAHSCGCRMRVSDVLLFLELIHVDTVS